MQAGKAALLRNLEAGDSCIEAITAKVNEVIWQAANAAIVKLRQERAGKGKYAVNRGNCGYSGRASAAGAVFCLLTEFEEPQAAALQVFSYTVKPVPDQGKEACQAALSSPQRPFTASERLYRGQFPRPTVPFLPLLSPSQLLSAGLKPICSH